MLKLSKGDRVMFTPLATRQFQQTSARTGVVTTAFYKQGMITVQRDGLKTTERWHHSFWTKVKP